MISLTYKDIERDINDLVSQITRFHIKFNRVVGIANGGLPVSKPLAEYLNLPHNHIHISCYGINKTPSTNPIVNLFDYQPSTNETILLVDDLLDNGNTLLCFKQLFPDLVQSRHYFFTCILYNPYNPHLLNADFFAQYKPKQWIHFPWE